PADRRGDVAGGRPGDRRRRAPARRRPAGISLRHRPPRLGSRRPRRQWARSRPANGARPRQGRQGAHRALRAARRDCAGGVPGGTRGARTALHQSARPAADGPIDPFDREAEAGDGQVTIGQTIVKASARKVRKLYNGGIVAGFAGAAADAFTLFARFEAKLDEHRGNLPRAAVELAKDWRTDRVLRRLEALLAV